ncbi:MAG: MarR family transcriptional regulator [Cellulosilyticum sp.]|nr:MarR family transcriptional regulator [Cellulosilyticum sp.]
MEQTKAIGFQLNELSRMIRRNLDEQINELHIDEITGVQGWIIGYIYRQSQEKDVFQRDIERAFHIRRSTVAETLRLMENKGLIIRESVEHDARLKKLVLTPKALQIQTQIATKIQEVEQKLISGLSKGELMLFLEIVDKMKSNLDHMGEVE